MMDYEEIKERLLRQQLREDRKLTTDELDREQPMDDDQEGTFYQIVCSCEPRTWTEVVSWLAVQIDHQFPTGEVIEHIDHFQIIPLNATDPQANAYFRAVATCSVYRPIQDA